MESIWSSAPTLPNPIILFKTKHFGIYPPPCMHACKDTAQEAKRPDEGPFNFHDARHRYRGWNVKRRRKLVACDHHMIPCDYASSEAIRRQNLMSSSPPPPPPLMQVMKYTVPTVLSLATLKYQAKPEVLFLENPAPVWCFVAATCVYWLIVGGVKQRTTIEAKGFQILSRAALTSALLSVLSLISMFLPYHFSRVPLLIWSPLPLALAWLNAHSLVHGGITSVVDKIHRIVVWVGGVNSTEEASNLPV